MQKTRAMDVKIEKEGKGETGKNPNFFEDRSPKIDDEGNDKGAWKFNIF